ncbi:MAG TPA: HdeD family acid-resistance protein [Anaerolineales bacterium]|nr:HdeD family acid-resistance protein [Anaerolineales bacterium]
MLKQLFRNWWLYLVRGVLAIAFGILALIWPGPTKYALVLLFGAFALVDGIFTIAAGIAFHKYFERWWAVLLEGLLGILLGFLAFFWTGITALALLYFIAAWAIITGIFEIVAAIQFRRLIEGEWMMILTGLLSMVFGALLFSFPTVGAVGLVWLIGIYAIVTGIMEIVFAFRLRGIKRVVESVLPLNI